MKAAVIGGNGFIGSHLIDELLRNKVEVSCLDISHERYRAPMHGVNYYYGAFDDPGLLAQILPGSDTVFHLVSASTPVTSNRDPAGDVQANVVRSLKLLESCVEHRVKKIVYLSSGGAVYGKPIQEPMTEDHPTNPESSYGITKLAIEKYLDLFLRLHGLEYTIIRPSNPFGPRQNPEGLQGAIAVFFGKIKRGEPIEIWGDGSVVRDFFAVEDLARGAYLAATKQSSYRIFNMGSGHGRSIAQILDLVAATAGLMPNLVRKPARPYDPPRAVLDISRATHELEWHPNADLEASLQRTWDFIKSLA